MKAQMPGQIQERPDHQQRAAEQAGKLEAGEAAFFSKAVKFRKPGQREDEDEQEENAVGNQVAAGEHGGENHRPASDIHWKISGATEIASRI